MNLYFTFYLPNDPDFVKRDRIKYGQDDDDGQGGLWYI